MKVLKSIFFLSLLLVISTHAQQLKSSTKIRDIIQPINLVAGISDSVLINDLFYSDNYQVKFKENKR